MTKTDDRLRTSITHLIARLSADGAVQKLLAYSLGRVLLNEARKADLVSVENLYSTDQLDHIRDWLAAAVVNDEPWLKTVDDLGRPKKLMKFGSVSVIVAEADKAMRKFAEKNRDIRVADGDESLAGTLDDGWYVVKLLTPKALDRESGQMQHCIGQGGYDMRVGDPDYGYFSLRDPIGKAHVTMEVWMSVGIPLQMRGKQNAEPTTAYLDRMLDFMKANGMTPMQLSPESRWVFDMKGNRIDIENIPDGVELTGDIRIENRKLALPKNLSVRGDLLVKNSEIAAMPETLTVGASMRVVGSVLSGVPKLITVGSDIEYRNTTCDGIAETVGVWHLEIIGPEIKVLPKGLTEHSSLTLRGTDGFKGLEKLTALNNLSISGSATPINLPAGLKLNNLGVSDSEMPEWPSRIAVRNSIGLTKTGLRKIPDDLTVHGDLLVFDNPIEALPKCLSVGGRLSISGTLIEAFPPDIEVGGAIIASASKLRSLDGLPLRLESLDITKTRVSVIPAGLTVDRDLKANHTPLAEIGECVSVGGRLHISHTYVEKLPDDIKVGEGLDASYSSLDAIPVGFSTAGSIDLSGSALKTLPQGLLVTGNLNVCDTGITEFPSGVVVEGDLFCVGTRVKTFPADMFVDGDVRHPLGNGAFPQSMDRMIGLMARNAKLDRKRNAAQP